MSHTGNDKSVYIVVDSDSNDIVGVFSTEEAAIDFCGESLDNGEADLLEWQVDSPPANGVEFHFDD